MGELIEIRRQPQRVADLVDEGLERIAVQAGAVGADPGGRDVDDGLGDRVAVAVGLTEGAGVIVVEVKVRRTGGG